MRGSLQTTKTLMASASASPPPDAKSCSRKKSPAPHAICRATIKVRLSDRDGVTMFGLIVALSHLDCRATRNRPKLEKLIEQLRKDDILVVTRLDRLARSTSDLLRIAERLTEKGAGLQSLDEPWADTTSPSGRMVMTIFAGIAEFERTLIISRTNDGRVAAKARGVAFGRPKKMRPDQQQLARELVRDGKSISAVARTFNVHTATIYRVIEG
jgi:DNA invertase Pin-like site-specific DNA recombinase